MGISDAPGIIRVKRKREDDSVQALLLQESGTVKRGKFVFRLAKTVESDADGQIEELDTPLLKLSEGGDARHFILEQRKRKREEPQLPAEISEMLNDYLSLAPTQNAEPGKLKRSNRRRSVHQPKPETLPSLSYVYDIYYKEAAPEDEFVFDPSTVGYIKIVEDSGDLLPEEDEDDKRDVFSDDQDSNEEAFYQNDYPEDEDDDRSVLFGSEVELGLHSNGEEDSDDELKAETVRDHMVTSLGNEETDALFERYSQTPQLLQVKDSNFFDLDDEESGNDDNVNSNDNDDRETDFKRHNFFPTDVDDPLAIHRDQIFGKLENMIARK
ncbi:LAFA_0G08768g1_1 [Lachancea sp. 'fantastica']|nr:LAFA_0G08768g1_1 [Lachancea sp. 'fantastica']